MKNIPTSPPWAKTVPDMPSFPPPPPPMISLGNYVLATKYTDRNPHDPWRVGFVCQIIKTWKGRPLTTYIIGEEDGTWSDFRPYRNAKRISVRQGKVWPEKYKGVT